jgi:hypothetical protein
MPGITVVEGALMTCDMGVAPVPLSVVTNETVTINGLPVATIMDHMPDANIPPFGVCKVLTAAASGVPTPCAMIPTAPWAPGSVVQTINGLPVLTAPATLVCGVGGVITIDEPGQEVEEST